MDDYCRATWVHLMAHKSNTFPLVKAFVIFIEQQFDTHVKIIRSDNDVNVNGSGITPQTSHQGKLKLKEGYGQKWHGRARKHGDPVPNCCPGKPKVPL